MSYAAFVSTWPTFIMNRMRLILLHEREGEEELEGALLDAGVAPVLQRYIAGYAPSACLEDAIRVTHHLVVPKAWDYDDIAACAVLTEAGVLEALNLASVKAKTDMAKILARMTSNKIGPGARSTRRGGDGCAKTSSRRRPPPSAPPTFAERWLRRA